MKETRIRYIIIALSFSVLTALALWILIFIYFSPRERIPRYEKTAGLASNISSNETTSLQRVTIDVRNFNKDYDYKQVEQRPHSVRVPILMYHHIGPLPNSTSSRHYFVTPETFEKQMKYLYEKHYRTLTPEELYDLLKAGKNPKQKSVMLTFDDGYYDNYENAYPILKKYGLTGVFYVVSDNSGIPISSLQEMSQNGMIIDSHSSTHADLLNETNPSKLSYEVSSSKYKIQHFTGRNVTSFAYPGCGFNGEAVSRVLNDNYLLAVSCGKSIDHTFGGRYQLSRMHVYSNLENFKKILSGIHEVTFDYE